MNIIYLSPVSWNSIAQRPHFFAKNCLEQGVENFYWIQPTASRFPKLSDFRTKVVGVESKGIEKPSNLHILNCSGLLPIEPLEDIYSKLNHVAIKYFIGKLQAIGFDSNNTILISGKPSRLALHMIEGFTFKKIIFDIMDDYPYFFDGIASKSVANLLTRSLSLSDEVWFSSTGLFDKYKDNTTVSKVIRNACDSSFVQSLQGVEKVNSDYCVYGYIGSIASWFDWDFVIKLAKSKPDSVVRLIGPCYTKLPDLPDNISVEPAVEHSEIASLLVSFDYGLIPFKLDELTEAVDPVKYYEYVAAGIPIISTAFGEMKHRVNEGKVLTLEMHLNGCMPKENEVITWEDRFKDIF
ncbi:glycosyltransferase [Photobacterium sp. TY1-4]|uniref:glycosyltransferase n=1 Tax=Photobacterium sp. TY1-4 TaxID=2899122 RepID=UPI0021C0695D|nr:glycosyltransferase [Photobacterium sp. TY1-4]UXI00541.1 glycosyltransferase [Photobacterium sp. TY1-4]